MNNGYVYRNRSDLSRLIYSRKDPGQGIPRLSPLHYPISLLGQLISIKH